MLRLLPWLVLIGGLLLTRGLWLHEQQHSLERLESDFDFRVSESAAFIERRMRTHEQMLRAFQGLFGVHQQVSEQEFLRYVEALGLKERYPGIRSVSFSKYVPAEAKRRVETTHAFSIRPDGEREAYAPIVHSVPIAAPSPEPRGSDSYAAAHSRAALERARDSGRESFSEKATFATGAGFLIHTAVYRGGIPPETEAERRAKLIGWVSLSFDMQRLMENVLGKPFADLDIEVYDGGPAAISADTQLYDSANGHRPGSRAALLHASRRLEFDGRPWTVTVASLPEFEARFEATKQRAIAIGGTLGSLLLASIVWLLLHGRDLAEEQVSRITRQLEQNERRYRLMFEDNASMSYLVDLETGRFVDVNPAAAAFWGYTREELLGMTIFEINAEPRERVAVALKRFSATGQAIHRETVHRLKSGELRDIEVFIGLLDYEGVPVCHVTFHDIGRRRKIEIDQIRALTDGYPVAVVMIDSNGFILMANPAVEKTFRYRREDLVGQYVGRLAPESVRARYGARLTEYMRDPQPLEVAEQPGLVAVRRDGEEFPVELRLAPFRMGGRSVIILSIYDVSARKQAELALRKLERAVEQTSVSIVITNAKGLIEYVNPVFSEITGYTREEAIGQNPRILQSGETQLEIYQTLWQTISNGGVWKGELRNRRKSGELFWEEVSISPVFNDAGGITNYISVKEDITERKRIEADLKQAKEAAEAASRTKSDFLAMISHEIRTPMNGVIGLSALLQETPLDPEQQKYAATLKQSAESLLYFINDILDFSKIEAGKLEVEVIDFDLRALLDHLHDMLAFRAREKKLQFSMSIDPKSPSMLRGDPGRLRQVLLNLLSNALKSTEHGEVALHVQLIDSEADECRLHFEARDTGIGIPADKLSSLFTPFTQVDSSTTRRYGGTGLGLAISKQLVELMGGRIGVISPSPACLARGAGDTASGSVFWFDMAFDRQEMFDQAPLNPLGNLEGKRVLVQSASATPRTVLDLLLGEWQCTAHFTAGDEEALALARALLEAGHPIDAAIIDPQGSDSDGLEFARKIRGDARLGNTPLLMLTSTPQRGDARRMKAAGFNAYLPKPVNAATLFNCLRRVIADAEHVLDPDWPLITQHTLAESERYARILLLAAHPDCPDCVQLARELRDRLGHRVEIVADARLALNEPGRQCLPCLPDLPDLPGLAKFAPARFDLVLLDGRMPAERLFAMAAWIRAGDLPAVQRGASLVSVFGDTSNDGRRRALAAGLDDVLPGPVDALLLDRCIVTALRTSKEGSAPGSVGPHFFAGRNPRLLLAEDNAVNQMVVLGLLHKLGVHDVVVVGNGLDALETVSRGDFDLVLMDCQMPVMDGFTATRSLRDLGCQVPVIAVTAHAMTGIQDRCLEAGMSDCIAKPIDFAEFANLLARWLGALPVTVEALTQGDKAADAEPTHASFERGLALERLRGDTALLNELIRVFIENWPTARHRLEAALAAADVTVATRESHTLKGSAMTVGAGLAGAVASQINEFGKQGRLADMQRLLPDLIREVECFMTAAKTLESAF